MIEHDEAVWRDRFIQINMTRIGGTLIVLFGLIVWQSNVFQVGGNAMIGFPLTIIGLVASFGGPIWMTKRWKRQDGR
jgi:hypothetical protein